MIFTRKENGHISCNHLELELLFNEILDETIETPKELKWCVEYLTRAIETAVHDWFEDKDYEDQYDHCQIEVYFDEDVEKVEE